MNWVGGVFYSDTERDYGQNLPVIGFQDAAAVCPEVTPMEEPTGL